MRVIIADDAPDILLVLRVTLTHGSNIEIVGEAESPDKTLEIVKEQRPDVAVIDMDFGRSISGIELAESVKAAVPTIKVVLFTAFDIVPEDSPAFEHIDAVVLKTNIHSLAAIIEGLT